MAISVNSARPCYALHAKTLNSARERNVLYIGFFSADRENGLVSYPFRKPGRV